MSKTITIAALFVAAYASSIAHATDRYCGIYAVAGAAAALDRTGDFSKLVTTEYVSSFSGSTAQDLLEASEAFGLKGTALWKLSGASLRGAEDPLILHVSSNGQLITYNHWLLFLGLEDGMARVLDGNDGVAKIPISNILARWDGVAIAVHEGQTPLTDFNQSESRQRAQWFFLALILLGPFAFLVKFQKSKKVTGSICFVASMLLVIAVRHSVAEDGFLNNKNTLAYVESAFAGGRFESMSMQDIAQEFESDSEIPFTLIDARYKTDFAQGAIPGAINIPVDSNLGTVATLVQHLDRSTPLVVYCHSSGCSFDRVVGIYLMGEGFQNVRLCSDGWVDWPQAYKTASDKGSVK